MAIGGILAPYVHTSFLNFKREEFGTTTRLNNKSPKLKKKINELKGISAALKQEARSFLGDKTPQQIFNEIYGENQSLVKIAREVLVSPGFYSRLNGNLKTKVSKQDLPKKIQEIISAHYTGQAESFYSDEVVTFLLKKIGTKKGTINKKIKNKLGDYFSNLFDGNIPKELNEALSNKLRSTSVNSKLFKALKEAIDANYNKGYTATIGPVVKEIFEEEFEKRYKKLNLAETSDIVKQKREYIEQVGDNIVKELKNKNARDKSNLYGYGGEELFAAVHNIKGSSLEITTTGSLPETEILKETLYSTKYNLRDSSKKSYSDLFIKHNGYRVRVQSKNWQTLYQKYLNTGNILQQMSLLKGEKVIDFLRRISGSELNIDLEEVAYVLANEAWFSSAGNIANKRKAKVEKMNLHQNYVDLVMADALVNYLGVIVENNVTNVDRSNIFYLIDNKALVPTYIIVDQLISNLKNWISNTEGIFFRIEKPKFTQANAKTLLRIKEDAVRGVGFVGSSYTDSKLLATGRGQGADIMAELKIKSINLNIDLKTLMTGSFVFDTDE